MLDKDQIIKIVETAKPNIKAKSRNVYVNNIMRVIKHYEDTYDNKVSSISFLNDFENVKKVLPDKTSTKKNYLMSLLIILHSDDKYKDVYEKYLKYTNEIIKLNDEYRNSQEKSESQKKNWIEWSKVEELLDDLKKEVYHYKINKIETLNKKNKQILQDYVLLSLYVYQAPRRAVYSDMKIITEAEYKKLTTDEKRENNWLVVNKKNRKKYFILTRFKTEKSQGISKINISKSMSRVLNLLLRFRDSGDWLLTNTKGNKMTANTLTKNLVRIFKPTGKRISINMLRHLYATNHSPAKNINFSKLKQEADNMGHSVEQHIKYIKSG